MKPKKFINDAADAVDEFISGLLIQYPNHLRKLANHHVILHSSFENKDAHPNKSRVSLLSGGGSGHEPSHAGFVGENMLSGAILGMNGRFMLRFHLSSFYLTSNFVCIRWNFCEPVSEFHPCCYSRCYFAIL